MREMYHREANYDNWQSKVYGTSHGTGSYKPSKTSYKGKVRKADVIRTKLGTNLWMTPKPPFGDHKTVGDYMRWLRSEGVKTIAVLLTDNELKTMGNLVNVYEGSGFEVLRYPIRDFNIPTDIAKFDHFLHTLRNRLKRNSIAVHCFGGNGRTGLVVASMLVQMGMDADDAMRFVRKRRPAAIETADQEDFIYDYQKYVEAYLDMYNEEPQENIVEMTQSFMIPGTNIILVKGDKIKIL